MTPRVVLDTNVVLSGLMWRGKAYQCLTLARIGLIQALYCGEMLGELSTKLCEKFEYSENHLHAVLYSVRSFAEVTRILGDLKIVTDDPDDDKFLECALVGKANFVISSDHHLLRNGLKRVDQGLCRCGL